MQAESQRKLTNEAKEQLTASKEQVAALKQQLEEAKKLKEQAEKAKMQAEEDKAKAEKERDEAEQHIYDVGVAEQHDYDVSHADVGVAEIEDVLQAEVPAVCRAYCAHTWEEALNQAGFEASSELRKPENIIFPPTLLIHSQKEVALPAPQPVKEAQPQHPPSTDQQEQGKEQETQKGPSSDKVIETPQPGAASQDFEKQLASVSLPAQGSLKDKEKETPLKVAD